ncbi:MAG: arginine--tRNA ligase [Candidatus Spechtbacterales bacterium]
MIREEIKKLIQKAANIRDEIKVEYPTDSAMGDYATNVAFLLGKSINKNPQDIAKMLAEKISSDKKAQKMFEKVEVAGAGFINFKLSKQFLSGYARSRAARQKHINLGKNRKLNIEFLSANPTGKFQVGNGRIGFYGDVLGNIFKLAGYKVTREYYINNAKSSNQIQELGRTALGLGDKYLTPYVKGKIGSLKLNVAGSDPATFGEAGYLLAQEIQKDNQEFLEKIGIHYNVWTREEEDLAQGGLIKKTLALLKKKNLVYEQDGAQWLMTTKFQDDKDKVIVRSSGEHGYYLADIAYHWGKIKRGYKVIIDIFGADHQGHVGPIKVAMSVLGYKGKFNVLVSQLVRAKGGGKLSKRAGNIVELEDLIDEVGVDAARFFYLMKSLDTQMEFDMDLAKEQSAKNPVYYVQYAHARMASILRNAPLSLRRRGVGGEVVSELEHSTELALIKMFLRWPEVIEDTANDYQVHRVTAYARELATVFNQFYRDCKVISDDKKLTEARLGLVVETQKTLQEVLWTLGISAPEKM